MSRFIQILLFICVLMLASLVSAQVDLKKKNPELGLNPPLPPGLAKPTVSSFTNIRVLPSTNHQSEASIAIHPTNSARLLGGANTDPGQGYYYSTNSGSTWNGSDHLLQTSVNATDPAVAFDRNGNAYFNYLDGNLLVAKSTDGGITWQNPVTISTSTNNPDKNYIVIDTNPNSSYQNYIYVVWTDFPGSNPIRFSRSTNGGQSFSGNLNISGGTTVVQGAVPAVGPNGNVYVVWGIGNPNQTGIGFNKSTDGGASFGSSSTITSVTQIGTLSNGRYRLKPSGIRVNSFPAIAVDRSIGINNGAIYVVWSDQRSISPGSGTPDILLIKSTDSGTTWSSSPVRVNNITTGDQWFPWIDVAPDGAIYVVFYDSRNDTSNVLTEVYVARSIDGGQFFANYKVSDTTFTPQPIPGYASGYMGDYIGITSSAGKAHPFWMDNRTNGIYQAYTAVLNFPTAPSSVIAFPASSGGNSVGLTWTNPNFSGFAGVLIWRKTASSFTQAPTQGSPPSQTPPSGITNVRYGNNTHYIDGGLTQGTAYYYQLFSYDNNYNYSPGVLISATPHKTTSTSTVATAYNNQHKMVYDGTNYHMVYETGGEIHYTYSNDNGSTWADELRISNANGGNIYPSIDITPGGIIVVVWQQEFPGSGKICMRRKTAGGWRTQQEVASFLTSSGFIATPVVSAYSAPTYFIIWHDYSLNNLTIRSYNESTGTLGTPTTIPSTNSNSLYPALAADTNLFLHLAWAESGAIYYTKISYNGSSYTFSPSKENVSSGTGYSNHVYPSITTDYSRRPSIAWQAYSGVALELQIILQRRRELSGSWSSATSFIGNEDFYKPSITSYPGIANNQKLRITCQELNLIKLFKYDGTSWTWFTESATGYDPNISATMGSSEAAKIVLRSGSASPYTITTTSQNLPKTTSTSIAHYRRGVMQIGKAEITFDLGDFLLQAGGNTTPIDLFAHNDTLVAGFTGDWNDMFRTEPITLASNSNLSFQNGFSVLNSHLLNDLLPPGAFVNFSLEAVHDKTGIPLAILYQKIANRIDTLQYWGQRQVAIPPELAGQPVYLRVAVSTQGPIIAKPSMVEIYQESTDSTGLPRLRLVDNRELPKIFRLHPNYPNPFNPQTMVRFDLPEANRVELIIFNAIGEQIKILVADYRAAGNYVERWDGRNTYGELAASGVYFLQMRAGDFKAVQKMILMQWFFWKNFLTAFVFSLMHFEQKSNV